MDEEDKVAEEIGKLGGFATPCDRLPQVACVYVDFSNRKVNEQLLKRLGDLPRIGSIKLNKSNITDSDLKHLTGLRQLQDLDLGDTSISDAGVKHLQVLKQLEFLCISGTKISETGFRKLRQELPKCEIDRSPPTSRSCRAGLRPVGYADNHAARWDS